MYSNRKVEEIIPIWKACFNDEESDIAFFFDYFGEKIETLTHIEDGKIVSMVNLLPAEVMTATGTKEAYYIYAVGTLPECRNRGYSSMLIKQVLKKAEQEEKIVFLVPAETALEEFYKILGFKVCCQEKNIRIDLKSNIGTGLTVPLIEIEKEQYIILRDKAFTGEGYMTCKPEALEYAIHLWRQDGGKCISITMGEKTFGALYCMEAGELKILEITTKSKGEAERVGKYLGVRIGAKCVTIKQSCKVMAVGIDENYIEKGFFNLSME